MKNLAPYTKRSLKESANIQKVQNEINRIYDQHLRQMMTPWEEMNHMPILEPNIEVCETKKNFKITAELPGMTAEEIDLDISDDGFLTITGEKRNETQQSEEGYYFSERSYGMIQRSIPIPANSDISGIDAEFEKGVLTIDIPKKCQSCEKQKKIAVKKKK